MRRAIVAAAVFAMVTAGLVATWLLVWRDQPNSDLAATTTSLVGTAHTTTTATTSSTTSATEPPPDSPNRVDLIGVVVAVERGAGWDTPPEGKCPDADLGPHPADCPLIGPATLVLDTGERLQVPAGTPGDRYLWRMAQHPHPSSGVTRQAIIAAALWEDGSVEWVYVLRAREVRGDPEPYPLLLPGGDVTALTPDGWVVTEQGWEYRLADRVLTTGCSHLWGFTWTLAGPSPAPDTPRRANPTELRDLWDGPELTRLTIGLLDYGTTLAIGDIECTDLLDRYHDPDPLGTLAAARALWAESGITDYSFRWSTGGAWGRWGGVWDITVRDGESTAVIVEQPWAEASPPPLTTEALFEMIEEELTGPGDWACGGSQYWTALYDPATGHPTSFYFNAPQCIDEEHGWGVENFTRP
jgi:Family of unknown function (DUF6174)